ncbi:MAG: hypothetical protein JXK94_10730, partial [Deltaproteobacteria bacterium]|nr:hypothetical protein [Deltaproteobacteria bacterium]
MGSCHGLLTGTRLRSRKGRQERSGGLFGPVAVSISAAYKTAMAALLRSDQIDQPILQGRWVTARAQEGIVGGIDEESRHPD